MASDKDTKLSKDDFIQKITENWKKDASDLKNPEFIKYCESFFASSVELVGEFVVLADLVRAS